MTQTALCHVGIRSPERCTSFADRQRRVPRGQARRKIPSGILPKGESTQTALCHVGIRSSERCTSFADRQRRVPRGQARRKIPSGILPKGESTQTALRCVGIRKVQRCTSFAEGKGEYRMSNGDTLYSFVKSCPSGIGQEERTLTVDKEGWITQEQTMRACPTNTNK